MTEPASVSLRRARADDAAAIGRVHVASWRAAYASFMPTEVIAALDAVQRGEAWRELLEAGERVWVAEDEAGLIGFAHVCPARDEDLAADVWTELASMYLHPDRQRTGIGGRLLERALEGAAPVCLWVLERNAAARSFYARAGFVEERGRKVHARSGLVELRMVRG